MSTIRFVQISDTHVTADAGRLVLDHHPDPALTTLVRHLAALSFPLDFILHNGDIVAEPDVTAYRHVAETIRGLPAPVYWVAGNHDQSTMLRTQLPHPAGAEFLAGTDRLAYRFHIGDHRFLVLDATGPPEMDPQGFLPEDQLDLLRDELSVDAPLTVAIHFPPVELDCPWIDQKMLLINGEQMHGLLRDHKDKVRAVFLGHIHRCLHVNRDGILYTSCGSSFSQFSVGPTDEDWAGEPPSEPAYNLVTLTSDRVVIKPMVAQKQR